MKFAWRRNITDLAAWNSGQIEEVDLNEYSEWLEADELLAELDKDEDEFFLEDDIILST